MATRTTKATSSAARSNDKGSASAAPQGVPGLGSRVSHEVARQLQLRLHALNDLQLTLKHAHWNVVGPHFIGVHEMLDPQVDGVRDMVDVIAERMATLGIPPVGTPGAIVADRSWSDYDVMRADVRVHLVALDKVYDGVIADHREVMDAVEDDLVTQDILVGQVAELEKYQWIVRAHLETASGDLQEAKPRES